MSTLKELWDEHHAAGKALPMVVELKGGTQFSCYFKIGKTIHGEGQDGIYYNFEEFSPDWKLHTPPKPKVERWQWVFMRGSGSELDTWTYPHWKSEDAINVINRSHDHWTLLGKDPNCLIPLVSET